MQTLHLFRQIGVKPSCVYVIIRVVKPIFNNRLIQHPTQKSVQKHKLAIAVLLLLLGLASPSLTLGQSTQAASAKATPLLGVGEDGDLSLGAERRMGDAIAKQIYRDPDYLDDPLLTEYVDGIWQSLLKAARAKGELTPEMDERFAWRVMLARDRTVNAFALPGGYFGVHLGLIGLVANQDELASVLAHELTHVTQRHISRSISQQGRQTKDFFPKLWGRFLYPASSYLSEFT